MTKSQILAKLNEHQKYLRKQYSIISIGLFGSYAKGKASESSDIDFYVIFEHKNFKNLTGTWNYLEEIFGKKLISFIHIKICVLNLRKVLKKKFVMDKKPIEGTHHKNETK